jgi:transmembrane sensor
MGSMTPPNMFHDRTEPHALAEEAAHWLIELEEPGPQVLRGFAAWLETSPRHVEEFLLAAAVWKELDHFDPERRVEIHQLIADARNNVLPLLATAAQGLNAPLSDSTRGKRRRLGVAAGVMAAILAAFAVWLLQGVGPHAYATSRGEQRAFQLEDGSVIYLNTQSRVQVRFSRDVRAIRLLEGEAMFTVEHDAARPFRVMAGQTVIQAIGTRFNVYRAPAGTTVSVVEGVVQISPRPQSASPPTSEAVAAQAQGDRSPAGIEAARVSAGEQARVSLAGEIVMRTVPDLAQVVAWRERRLVFHGDSLEDVATEFNRYNALQIHVQGDAIRNRHITGVFNADDPRSFILFLERDAALAVDDGDAEVTVRQRRSPSGAL